MGRSNGALGIRTLLAMLPLALWTLRLLFAMKPVCPPTVLLLLKIVPTWLQIALSGSQIALLCLPRDFI